MQTGASSVPSGSPCTRGACPRGLGVSTLPSEHTTRRKKSYWFCVRRFSSPTGIPSKTGTSFEFWTDFVFCLSGELGEDCILALDYTSLLPLHFLPPLVSPFPLPPSHIPPGVALCGHRGGEKVELDEFERRGRELILVRKDVEGCGGCMRTGTLRLTGWREEVAEEEEPKAWVLVREDNQPPWGRQGWDPEATAECGKSQGAGKCQVWDTLSLRDSARWPDTRQ